MNKKVWFIAFGILCFISHMVYGISIQLLKVYGIQNWVIATTIYSSMIFGFTLSYLSLELFIPFILKNLNKVNKFKKKNGVL